MQEKWLQFGLVRFGTLRQDQPALFHSRLDRHDVFRQFGRWMHHKPRAIRGVGDNCAPGNYLRPPAVIDLTIQVVPRDDWFFDFWWHFYSALSLVNKN